MFSLCTVPTLALALLVRAIDGSPHSRTNCNLTPLPEPVLCGVLKLQPKGLSLRESEAIREEFPWHAALYQEQNDQFDYCCGGSLINERFVLTAAHCLVNPKTGYKIVAERVKVKLGLHELNEEDECVQELTAKKIHMHDQFASQSGHYDIALIELSDRVVYTRRVLPVCLDTSEKQAHNFFDLYGKVPGWGYTEHNNVSNWLRMTYLPFANYTHCLNSNPGVFANTINEGMFCAGRSNGTSVCNGDSGGGLVTYDSHRYILRGIVSFTALRDGDAVICHIEHFAGFTKVRFYRSWLMKITNGSIPEPDTETPLVRMDTSEEVQQPPCGKRKITKQNLIVNGVRSYSGEWPWHVAVFEMNGPEKKYICGGTLINDQYVMTAAQCMLDEDFEQRNGTIVVQLGQNNLIESSSNMRELRVDEVTINDQFDVFKEQSDIALLKLTTTVQFNDYIQPVCLPKKKDTGEAKLIGSSASVVGWGYQDVSSRMFSDTLQAAKVQIVDFSNCIAGTRFGHETDSTICTGPANGSNVCAGDSGGGLFIEKDGVWTVQGIIPALDTKDEFCNPNGYLKVSSTRPSLKWIKKLVEITIDSTKGNGGAMHSFSPFIQFYVIMSAVIIALFIAFIYKHGKQTVQVFVNVP